MNTSSRLFPLGGILFALSISSGACQQAQPASPPEPAYATTATIKDLMLSLVDPSADVVWGAVGTYVSAAGVEERVPTTDDEWTEVRRGAIRLAEATNLLMMPGRHVARPGEKSEAPGVELEPEEMEVLIEQDRESWNMRAKALHDASLEVLDAVDARNAEALWDIGERIEHACEGCHSSYWYPNQVLPPGYGQ